VDDAIARGPPAALPLPVLPFDEDLERPPDELPVARRLQLFLEREKA
jgi:hypothetical protein